MTTFAEMQVLVEAQTKRPEIPAITQSAIRTATLRAHHTDFFGRDLAVSGSGVLSYVISSSAVFYDITGISATLARLRKLELLQSVDTAGAPVEVLEYRAVDDLYDSDNVRRTSLYNRIGDTLRVYPQRASGLLSAIYYTNPVVSPAASYNSWIADDHPDELAMWASAIVWARTGFMELASETQKIHVEPFKAQLIADYLLD